MSEALVVLSGGLDSCVALALADQRHGGSVSTISFKYGQRHLSEIEAAIKISAFYGATHHILDVPLGKGGVLMDHDAEMPHMTYEELKESEGPSPTYVPYRNGTFLSLAASAALDMGASVMYAGMHAEDAHNWAYPDCTPEFVGAMQCAIYIGTYMKVRLEAPFTYKTKAEIVKLGIDLAAPLHLTRSCYEGRDLACGRCPTCIGRLEAFLANDIQDPIDYEFDKYREGLSKQAVRASLELKKALDEQI